MNHLAVVLNRHAGKHRRFRGVIANELKEILGPRGMLYEVNNPAEMDAALANCRNQKIKILCISGGDGTNAYVLTHLIRGYGDNPLPAIAFLCGGTHNAHALSLGIRGTPQKLLRGLLGQLDAGKQPARIPRHILRVAADANVHYGFSLASGFMYKFMEDLEAHHGTSVGRTALRFATWMGSALVYGKKIRHAFQKSPALVELDGQRLAWSELNGLTVSAMEKLGLGFTPYVRAGEQPGKFVVGITRVGPGAFMKMIWAFKRARVPVHRDLVYDLVGQVRLETAEAYPYVLDGELYPGGRCLTIQAGPRLEFVTP